jgi:DNA-binding transcriptional LysR family regulator
VLADWQLPTYPVHAVFPSNRYLSANVRAFVDLAADAFGPGAQSSVSSTGA